MQARNLVLERAQELTLVECNELDRLAFDQHSPIIDQELTEALERAIEAVDADRIYRLATDTSRALAESQCHDHHRAGALTCAWAAAIACSGWRLISPADVEELTWRWQSVTGQRITDHVHACQEARGVTRDFQRVMAAQALADLAAEMADELELAR